MLWVWIAVFLLVLWFPQNCIHEGAHALVAVLIGAKVESFKPWPHKTEEGRRVWARVVFNDDLPTWTVDWRWGIVHFAPVLANVLFVLVGMVVCAIFKMPVPLSGFVLAFICANMIDGLNNERKALFRYDEIDQMRYDVLKFMVRIGRVGSLDVKSHAISVSVVLIVAFTVATASQV